MKKMAVFASGSGTNFQSIAKACKSKIINADCCLLVTDKADIGAIGISKSLGIPYRVFSMSNYETLDAWDFDLSNSLLEHKIEFIALAGFLKKIGPNVLKNFKDKMVNIHPSLLPKFGGAGMYGMKVHRTVIEAGETKSGTSIHWVTENFDEGPIIAQKEVAIKPGTTAKELCDLIKALENNFYVETLANLLR